MKRAIAILFLLLFGCHHAKVAPPPPIRIVVIHTNDLHGQAYPRKNAEGKLVGGFTHIAARIKRERAEAERGGDGFLLVDCGDFFQGTPEGDLTHGMLPLEWMNLMHYDVIEAGNHEFDQGQKTLLDLAAQARCPVLCGGVWGDVHGTPFLPRIADLDVHSVSARFGGVITSQLRQVCMERNLGGIHATEELQFIRNFLIVPGYPYGRTDVLVLLTHCGFETDKRIAAEFPDIPIIFGGHSHTPLADGWREPTTGVLVCQNAASGATITKAVLTFDGATHKLLHSEAHNIPITEAEGHDAETDALLARYAPEIEKTMSQPVCEVAERLSRDGGASSSTLGNLVSDAIRDAAHADVAFHNRTGMRADLDAGTARLREMYQVSPFANNVVVMDLTGAQIKDLLEESLSKHLTYLETSGASIEYDAEGTEGQVVRSLSIGGVQVDPARTYRVATNSFLAPGGDGHTVFTQGKIVTDTNVTVLDAQIAWAKAHAPIRADRTRRIHPLHEHNRLPVPTRRRAA